MPVGAGSPLRRELLDRVLDAVRRLGTAGSLDEVLQKIAEDVVEVLGFRAAAFNAVAPDGRLYVRAVAGPEGVKELLHTSASRAEWDAMLAMATRSGEVYFLSHDNLDDPAIKAIEAWTDEHVPDLIDGGWDSRDTLLAPLRDGDGRLVGVLSVDLLPGAIDDPELRTALELFVVQAAQAMVAAGRRDRLEGRRRDAERRWELVWETGLIAGGVLDDAGIVLDINDAGAHCLGWAPGDLIGRHFFDVVPAGGTADAGARFGRLIGGGATQVSERVLLHRDGHEIWTDMHATGVVVGESLQTQLIVQWTDITERKQSEQRMVHQLRHDALTDLPNRRALEELLADLFEREVPFGLLYCDIDGFKSIADGLGHEAGDQLLKMVAGRLRSTLAPEVWLARLAGDEFVACITGSNAVADVTAVAAELVTGLDEPFTVNGRRHTVRMSVGVSTTRPWHRHPVDVLREADHALLRAKRRGRNRVEVFDPGQDHPATLGDLELEQALHDALDARRELEPYFQSVISLTSGATVGYEALLRWRHPGHGLLLPERFLPIAERAGLSASLGWRMLELVGAAMPRRRVAGARPWIAVNVSASQLGRGVLPGALRRLIDSALSGDPAGLHIEITETSLLDASPATIDELYAVAELGVQIALDDFGTGYSSLTLLRDLPVSSVKIDRSFIAPIAVDVRARTIVQHTIELCQGLGMTTVAEGIETHEQLAWLQTLGCEFGQGYLIDRPSPWPFDVEDRVGIEPPRRFNG